jgi:hypothetical protein
MTIDEYDINILPKDFGELRQMLSSLSGVPAMAITTYEHVARIKEAVSAYEKAKNPRPTECCTAEQSRLRIIQGEQVLICDVCGFARYPSLAEVEIINVAYEQAKNMGDDSIRKDECLGLASNPQVKCNGLAPASPANTEANYWKTRYKLLNGKTCNASTALVKKLVDVLQKIKISNDGDYIIIDEALTEAQAWLERQEGKTSAGIDILEFMQEEFVSAYKQVYFKDPQGSHRAAIETVYKAILPFLHKPELALQLVNEHETQSGLEERK